MNVDVVVDGFPLAVAHLGTLFGSADFILDSDDIVVAFFHADGGFERVLIGEEFADEILGDDADVALESFIGGGEKAAGHEVDILHEGIGGKGANDLS